MKRAYLVFHSSNHAHQFSSEVDVWTYASLLSSASVSTGRGGGGAARVAVGSGLPSAFRFLSTWFRRTSLFETPFKKFPKIKQKQ